MNNYGTLYPIHFAAIDQDPLSRKAMRDKIEADTKQFLAGGGDIEEGPDLIERPDYARPVYWGQNEGNA